MPDCRVSGLQSMQHILYCLSWFRWSNSMRTWDGRSSPCVMYGAGFPASARACALLGRTRCSTGIHRSDAAPRLKKPVCSITEACFDYHASHAVQPACGLPGISVNVLIQWARWRASAFSARFDAARSACVLCHASCARASAIRRLMSAASAASFCRTRTCHEQLHKVILALIMHSNCATPNNTTLVHGYIQYLFLRCDLLSGAMRAPEAQIVSRLERRCVIRREAV